ncbi:type III-B CRISPR-associated protein Cas10/Cmr2 [Synechocystis salina]|uniref:Type III-B CRISPR-associated protein Cas10/Cmr2 n=1 Tax=Synechocystis salina LEGE 00031 TaxID=1828736 RepID=A0ABR9VSY9_9SYNC|nr:type III-B CRISPR-associated protein Cas10/Cmr2 [Synechocystis salina LEGE 00041]MBE9254470.1 type III-B CRISPR-associated protein Cas10/Cmr2 [Synechocystis salina LEGE 00031]
MSEVYWQAKIWGLLHDPALKALHNNSGRGGEGVWQSLACMQNWVSPKSSEEKKEGELSNTWLDHVGLSDLIASASDRGAIHHIGTFIDYDTDGLNLCHLLSGAKLPLTFTNHDEILGQSNRRQYLNQKEQTLIEQMPTQLRQAPEKAQDCFWWLWRCLPEAVAQEFGAESLLMPAETRLPDASIWSHASMTAALAGALAGYDTNAEDIAKGSRNTPKSQAYLAVFTFSPVQELIKASRKIKDFWAGSWVLHYLSAKVCWELAQQYGPDCFLYPSLYGQPLIDHWLLEKYGDYGFDQWITQPNDRQLLTAGFPNVIMLVLPKEKVAAAMQSAKNYLLSAWRDIAQQVFEELQDNRYWQKDLNPNDPTWKNWLDAQWQTYWSAMAIGSDATNVSLKSAGIPTQTPEKEQELNNWIDQQNKAFNADLFKQEELAFIKKSTEQFIKQRNRNYAGSLNVGSWWADIFGQTRFTLSAVKNARNWKLPTAFGPRSTISGMGPVVHPQSTQHQRDWVTEGETQHYWQRQAGLFDGSEQLNATETVKRGLEKILAKLLHLKNDDEEKLKIIAASYPDLTSGVAGYLHTGNDLNRQQFDRACQTILDEFSWAEDVINGMKTKWGIPLMDKKPQKYHPRLLNAGWLVEDVESEKLQQLQDELKKAKQSQDSQEVAQIQNAISQIKVQYRRNLQNCLDRLFPKNNPANWYVLAAGDGDGMSEWLKGTKMKNYKDYFPQTLLTYFSKTLSLSEEFKRIFEAFSNEKKRMGPATHNALSRALLDFSNQLAPYLTEQRYAGRLIYSGGDDVLAYSNLWEWDSWLWDIRQAFRGDRDEQGEFDHTGHYWRLKDPCEGFPKRPLFTMGNEATISFGITIAHHSVPLAIALENLWKAEEGAKDHEYDLDGKPKGKDAVQVRVLYGNGNVLKATCKFETFQQWQALLNIEDIDASTCETAATLLDQHPIPVYDAIMPWVNAFTKRRSNLKEGLEPILRSRLACFLIKLWQTTNHTKDNEWEKEAKNWLKVAAFVKRNRQIV